MTPPADVPVRPPRPRTVTIAFWLQLTLVAVLLGLVALVVVEAIDWNAQIDRAARAVPNADPDEVSGERVGNVVTSVLLGLPTLLLAAWMAATALPVRRGGNTARIMVFVGGGAQLLLCMAPACAGMISAPLFLASGFDEEMYPEEEGGTSVDDPWSESRFIEALYDSPNPFDQVLFPLAAVGILTVLTLTAAIVLLLALPPAHRWFVPHTTAPTPPVPFAPLPPPGYGYGYQPAAAPPGYGYHPPAFLICPDPAAHLGPPPGGGAPPGGTPTGPEPAGPSGPVTPGS
ncbi:hypothetical protein ACTMSW_21310 [Micromonospora sp. BQ11]|uniref:hypothetical protein n=1 Tax=Micromonospora sp. BQ11 TaxID=3452212 RepID=UPI003F890FEE